MSTRYMLKQYVPMIAFAIFSLLAVLVQHEISYAASALASVTAEVVVATKAALSLGSIAPMINSESPINDSCVKITAAIKDNPLTCSVRVPKDGISKIIHNGKGIAVKAFVFNLNGRRTVQAIRKDLCIETWLHVNMKEKIDKSCTGLFQVSLDYN